MRASTTFFCVDFADGPDPKKIAYRKFFEEMREPGSSGRKSLADAVRIKRENRTCKKKKKNDIIKLTGVDKHAYKYEISNKFNSHTR